MTVAMVDEPMIYREAQRKMIHVRASAMAGLFDCAYRFEAIHILKMRMPPSPRMVLGTAIHRSTAHFDQARMDRNTFIRPDDSAGLLVDHLQHPGEDVVWDSDDITKRDAERIGLTLHGKYCAHFSPQYDFAAVELDLGTLDIDVPEQGVTVRITGTLDRSRARHDSRGLGITDLKTGVRAATKDGRATVKGHGIQVGLYELLYERATQQRITAPAEILGLGTSQQTPIGRSEIATAKRQVLGDHATPSLIEMVADTLRSGLFRPNPQSRVCGPKYCPRWSTCKFHE